MDVFTAFFGRLTLLPARSVSRGQISKAWVGVNGYLFSSMSPLWYAASILSARTWAHDPIFRVNSGYACHAISISIAIAIEIGIDQPYVGAQLVPYQL